MVEADGAAFKLGRWVEFSRETEVMTKKKPCILNFSVGLISIFEQQKKSLREVKEIAKSISKQ